MSLAQVDAAYVSNHPSVLGRIRRPRIDIAVWQRALPASLTRDLARWVFETEAAPFDAIVRAPAPVDLALASLPDALRRDLSADLSALLDVFTELTHAKRFRLFAGVVRTDQCRKFHVDAIELRMITTYVGPGTEWMASDDGVRRARAGDVLMLRGGLGSVGRGAVHRSPPIEHVGARRFVVMATLGGAIA